MQSILNENKIEFIFHFISSTVPATSNNMRFDIESNLIPSVELLECMVRSRVKNIVYLSSGGAIYGSSHEKHRETDNSIPISSYGDAINILFSLLAEGVMNETINIGSGDILSVNDIVNNITKLVPGFEYTSMEANMFDVSNVRLDTSRLSKFIGDYSFVPFPGGLLKTLEWLKMDIESSKSR